MAAWILVPCLRSLFAEFDHLAPNRDHVTDGAVGDRAHAAKGSSDHLPDEETPALRHKDADGQNEVHAIDVDRDLKLPGWSMDRAVQIIVTRCRSGEETRLAYVIYNRRIWSRTWSWQARVYTGSNPHDHHAHFSARYDNASEQNTRPWGLLEQEDDVLNADDKKWLSAEIAAQIAAAVKALPTAEQNGQASLRAIRQSPTTGISDTGVNLIGAQITEAILGGVAIKRFPANKDK